MQYNFLHSLGKTAVRLGLIAASVLLTHVPASILNLTISGVLMLGFDWAKAKYASL